MVAYSAVAEHAVGEGPDVQVVVSLLCGPASFGVTAQPVGLSLTIESLPPPTEGAVAEFAVAEAPPNSALGAAVFSLAGRATLGAVAAAHDPAAFTLAGQPAGIAWAHPPAGFALAGQSLAFAGTASFSPAAFALTGRAVVFDTDRGATLASGEGAVAEFAVAEFPALTRFGLYAGAASFAVSGQALALRTSLSAVTASFALAGGPAQIAWAHAPAAFALGGQPLGLRTDLAAASGSFALAGGAAQIAWAHDPASFAWTGNAATLDATFIVAQASFALTLLPVFVGIRTEPGAFALGVVAADLHPGLAIAPAAFALAGQPANLLNIFKLYPDAAVFTLTGQDAGRAYTLGAEVGAFTLSGFTAFSTAIGNSGWLAPPGYPADDPDHLGASIWHLWPQPVTARYWRIELDDETNPAGFIEAGRLFMPTTWVPPYNFDDSSNSDGLTPNTPRQDSLGGVGYFNRRTPTRTLRLAFGVLDATEMTSIRRIRRLCNLNRQVIVVPNPDDTANFAERNFLATLREMPAISLFGLHASTGFDLVEVVP